MKNSKKLLSLLLAGVMSVGLLAGCANNGGGDTQPSASAAPSDSAAPSAVPSDNAGELTSTFDGKNLSVCVASEPKTMDPALSNTVDGAILFSHLFEGLIKRVDDGSGNAVRAPGQALSWEKSAPNADGEVTWTFKMNPEARWSDGQRVTAGDFVYTWQRLVNPNTGAEYAYQLDMVKGYKEVQEGGADPSTLAVSAPDDDTFVVTLSYDCPYFEDIAAFPVTYPVRQDMIEAHGDEWTYSVDTYLSNGPFKLTAWEHNSYIEMVPNEQYYDLSGVQLESLTFALMDDDNAQLASYRAGDLQFIENMPIGEIAGLLASGELKINPYLGTYFAIFNNSKAPFDNANVRRAFSLAIDRNFIVESVSQAGEVPADSFVSPGIFDAGGPGTDFYETGKAPYYSASKEDYEKNCEEARQLLADAGYPGGEGFPVVNYIFNTNDNHQKIAEALQNMWQTELGVTVQINNMDWNAFIDARQKGEYDVARHGWITDYNDPMSYLDMWMTGNGNNDAQMSNPEYDAFMAEAKGSADPAVRMAAMHNAEDVLMDQMGIAPIYFYTNKFLLDPTVKGMVYDPMGYFIFTYCSKG